MADEELPPDPDLEEEEEEEEEPTCPTCDEPQGECICCGGCDRHPEDCICCPDCGCRYCECEQEDDGPSPDISFIESPIVFHKAGKKQFKRNPSRRFISLELEVDGVCGWAYGVEEVCRRRSHSVVEDGSLSNAGFEINTSPAQGDVFCGLVEEVCAALNKYGPRVTQKCGMHVHVDCRDYNHWDIRKLVQLYRRIEPALLKVVAPSRRYNSFCQVCANDLWADLMRWPKAPKKSLEYGLYGTHDGRRTKSYKRDKHGSGKRYYSLNLHSWAMRGTVECRLHQGTTDAIKATNWGVLWAGILDWNYRATGKELSSLPPDPFEALLAVSPTDEIREYLKQRKKELN